MALDDMGAAELKALRRAERSAELKASASDDDFKEKLGGLVDMLKAEADKRQTARLPIEAEWIEDIEQIHGIYDETTRANFLLPDRAGKSRLFMNRTREKVQTKVSGLMDTLFPSDDKNWGIQPTPVPEMAAEAEKAEIKAANLSKEAEGNVDKAPEAVAAQMEADRLGAIMAEAEDRAKLMEAEIADQLVECRYAVHSRDVLEDGVSTGTGVMMGPMTDVKSARKWVQSVNPKTKQPIEGAFEIAQSSDPRPAMWRVDFWNFFPSNGATCPEDSEGFYVRYPWTARKLRDFAKVKGVDKDAVRELLVEKPKDTVPNYLLQLRNIGRDTSTNPLDNLYMVWMYCGPLEPDQMKMLATAMGDPDTIDDMDEVDPLDEVQAIVWFCGNRVLKLAIYPFDSGDPLFSVWRYEKEPGSFWGYGIGRIMRDDQSALNAGWRMMMDNGDMSAGPQVFIDTNRVEPVNGVWTLKGTKLWQTKPNAGPMTGNEMQVFSIPSNQGEMANIIELARRSIDETTHTPMMEQGEPGAGLMNTATGAALIQSASRRNDKRLIQNWDDDFTVPNIQRMYDWNMQHSRKTYIKGDYKIEARGSNVLLVRAQNTSNLSVMLSMFAGDPEFKALEAKREFARAIGYRPDQFFVTDAEAEAIEPAEDPMAALKQQELEIRESEVQAKVSIAEMEGDSRLQVAELQHETQMMKLAEMANISLEEIQADLIKHREATRSKERTIAAEMAARASQQAPLNQTQIANT